VNKIFIGHFPFSNSHFPFEESSDSQNQNDQMKKGKWK